MLIMGTRAAAFTAKVRSLNDFQLRLLHGILPVPSGVDIANTLKYFSQTLLTILKDVPGSPLEMLTSREKDATRLGLFPSLEYKGLYKAITQLIEAAPLIQYGIQPFGTSVLQCLGCLLPFLDHEMIDTLPYLVASALSVLPASLHQDVVNSLCFYILPFTITRRTEYEESYACQSVMSVIMLVFQHSSTPYHSQLTECLMALKPGVVRDMLCVIAHGTSKARASAARLLFYYWPTFDPVLCDLKGAQFKVETNWTPFVCQRDMCPNAGNAEAAKVCYDHCISITFSSNSPPPLYLCIECANAIHREHPNQMFYDILHPIQNVSPTCENKNCRAQDKQVVSVCFAAECASYNGNHPIRFCQQCHNNRHNKKRGGDHIVHQKLPYLWEMDAEMQIYLIESVVSLLKETKPGPNNPLSKDVNENARSFLLGVTPPPEDITLEESQILGRYGIWLLVGLCTPRDDTIPEVLGRLLSMLFHWFYVTAYLYDDSVLSEGTIEKLKNEHICGWLNGVTKNHFKVFVSCLMPHPPEYARVGGHWDVLASKTWHLKEGLHRLLCLVPYEVVSAETWEHIMPRWLQAIVTDVPARELHQLKLLLSKILDPVMSPLGFESKKMYRFLTVRFKRTTSKVQEQALNWLQVLTTLEIVVPLPLLFSVFNDGVKMMQPTLKKKGKGDDELGAEEERRSSISPVKDDTLDNISLEVSEIEEPIVKRRQPVTDLEYDLSCCILMLDILLKQMELQNIDKHTGINTSLAQDVWQLTRFMMSAKWASAHQCEKKECPNCEARAMWYQLVLDLVTRISPKHTAHPPDTYVEEPSEEEKSRKSPPESEKKHESKSDVVINMPMPLLEVHSVGGVLVHMPHIMTATVETVAEQLDIAPVVSAEKAKPAVAKQVTIADAEVATDTAQVAKTTLVGENDELLKGSEEDSANLWDTSEGKVRFVIDELPAYLQLLHALLSALPNSNSNEQYLALQCIHIMVLHGDAFTKASKENRGFFIWSQENLLIKNMWELCNACKSHIGEVAVPLLLHCASYPSGSDTFWNVVQKDFHHKDWRVRFTAVDRATLTARFMDNTPLANKPYLQSALANVFCHLITSMDDENVQVAQRATLYLGTIHDSALRSLVGCLETQFDTVVEDRPIVLQALYQLHNCLSDRKILTWEFFLSRFDSLFLEAQINLEKSGDISFVRDLKNSNLNSETFTQKLNKAHEALSKTETTIGRPRRTLSAVFGPKWPYKRTMSAPATMAHQSDTKQEKEKVYTRQYSAPILKRKSSRFGLGQFLGSVPANANVSLPDGHIHQLVAGDDSGLAGLTKVLNLEGNDHETIHLLIFLLMQFLSRSDEAFPTEGKSTSRIQTIVLRHLFLLLGYSQQESTFYVPPQRLRMSPVFNAFLSNLPQVLDQNHLMGWLVAGPGMAVLQHCPAGKNSGSTSIPNYTLWLLEPHSRRCWLMSVLVLLYKYNYNQQPQCAQLTALIRIVLNTLGAQHHVCKRVPSSSSIGATSTRSRDASQPSLGVEKDDASVAAEKMDTPPLSPVCPTETKQKSYIQKSPAGPMETHWEEPDGKTPQSSTDAEDDVDGSHWKSESTLRVSPHDTVEVTGERKTFTYDKVKPSWFLSGDDKKEATEERGRKCGVKQGVMMMMTSPFFASSQPVTSKSTASSHETASQSKPPLPPATSSERRPSLASAVATAMQPVVATATVVSVPAKQTSSGGRSVVITTTTTASFLPISPSITTQRSIEPKTDKPKSSDGSGIKPVQISPHPAQIEATTSISTLARPQHTDSLASFPRTVTIPWRIESAISSTEEKYTEGTTRAMDFEYSSHGSPESPLSKMDIITLGSPVDVDGANNRDHCTINIPELEPPPLERLLPVGPCQDVVSITEKLLRAIGSDYRTKKSSGIAEKEEGQSTEDETKTTSDTSAGRASRQDSLDKSDARGAHHTKSSSPRKLIKQEALAESPPEEETRSFYRDVHTEKKHHHQPGHGHEESSRKKAEQVSGKDKRNAGLFSMGSTPTTNLPRRPGSWCGSEQPLLDAAAQQACHAAFDLRQSSFRVGDECVLQRCTDCGAPREEYSDEELGLCIVILGTFIHREPGLAAPLLPEILAIISKLSLTTAYAWQNEGGSYLPGGAVSVAHQFLRCTLHQLAPNGVFHQIFQTHVDDSTRQEFFRSVAQALIDFTELNPSAPLQLILETLNTKKTIPPELMVTICKNIAAYMDNLPLESCFVQSGSPWYSLLTQMEIFFRRIVLLLPSMDDVLTPVSIMSSILKLPGISIYKGILEPFSKLMSYVIQNTTVELSVVLELCHLCGRAFTRDREKYTFTRMLIYELVQALKFKTHIADANFVMLINFVIHDTGSCLVRGCTISCTPEPNGTGTNASEIMRQNLTEALDFLTDFHTINKVKGFSQSDVGGFNEDTLGGALKSATAQYIALEMARSTKDSTKNNHILARHLPWLYNAPSSFQQGPREFLECMSRIRLLSWLLAGGLLQNLTGHVPCLPIPPESSCYVADQIQVIFAGFAEQSKTSVLHMSSLYHAFILCQLWTVYLEAAANSNPPGSELFNICNNIQLEFWIKVTPCILQLIAHSRVLAEMVNLHFLGLLEALLEVNASLLGKLLPIWSPVFYANHIQLPGQLQVRLQNIRNFAPSSSPTNNVLLAKWLQRLQFKMGQIELQSSAATHFYPV